MGSILGFVVAVGSISAIYVAFVSHVIKNAANQLDENTERQYDSHTTSYLIS